MSKIETILHEFKPISLAEMDRVKLMNRTDTKFAFSIQKFIEFLGSLNQFYDVLEIEKTRTPHYESLYFDDDQFTFFKDHHNGKTNRFKVRIRKYVESEILFLEIKHKFKGRTDKKRIPTKAFDEAFDEKQRQFLTKQLQSENQLVPTMWNSFQRITLINRTLNERLTFDFNINFHHQNTERNFNNLVIAELKQETLNRNSPFYTLMKNQQIRPYRLSKYCLGSIELYGRNQLKFNRFKKKLLHLKKIENDII
ncbi:MAG: polyphosphate polymerase domain-containing protein [Flavobacteriales bacterium]|nr:polyphosphate polymerase domain-containing protein [Flavobacteriales bacterium]